VRGTVVDAEIGFHFHDAAGGLAVNQNFTETIARDLDGGAIVEVAIEEARLGQEVGKRYGKCRLMRGRAPLRSRFGQAASDFPRDSRCCLGLSG